MNLSLRRLAPLTLIFGALLLLSGCVGGSNMADLFYNPFGGVCTLIVLILDIVAVIEVFGSSKDTMSKVLWILAIFFMPVVGLILYYFFGR